jgi:hypothetical protein
MSLREAEYYKVACPTHSMYSKEYIEGIHTHCNLYKVICECTDDFIFTAISRDNYRLFKLGILYYNYRDT